MGRSRMARTFVEGNWEITVESEQVERRPGTRWRATAVCFSRLTGGKLEEVRTLAEHGSAERAEERALVMLRDRLHGAHIAE